MRQLLQGKIYPCRTKLFWNGERQKYEIESTDYIFDKLIVKHKDEALKYFRRAGCKFKVRTKPSLVGANMGSPLHEIIGFKGRV